MFCFHFYVSSCFIRRNTKIFVALCWLVHVHILLRTFGCDLILTNLLQRALQWSASSTSALWLRSLPWQSISGMLQYSCRTETNAASSTSFYDFMLLLLGLASRLQSERSFVVWCLLWYPSMTHDCTRTCSKCKRHRVRVRHQIFTNPLQYTMDANSIGFWSNFHGKTPRFSANEDGAKSLTSLFCWMRIPCNYNETHKN